MNETRPAVGAPPVQDRSADTAYVAMLQRLAKLSVERGHDAYADIDWDAPQMALGADDTHAWGLLSFDPLAGTDWYQALPAACRAEVAQDRIATMMKVGWQFENLLQRGLLVRATHLRNGAPEFRYLHHEVIEESQHTLMFQEFVNRTGLPVRGMPRSLQLAASVLMPVAGAFPTLFFVFVLGGEDPIDHFQRLALREGDLHPLVAAIVRIHVTEEARHLSFARHYLRRTVPRLRAPQRGAVAVAAPVVLGVMARLMLEPSHDSRRRYGMPRAQLRRAFATPAGRRLRRDSVAATRKLCREVGLVNRATTPIWQLMGIWDDDTPGDVGATSPRRSAASTAA